MDEPNQNPAVEIAAAEAFALLLETACEDFELAQDLIAGRLRVASASDAQTDNTVVSRKLELRSLRASPRIQMALAKSFLFHARRANRVCTFNKAALNIDRADRKQFLKDTDPLTAVRDVNEHGFDGKGSIKPSMHEQEGGTLDETSMVIAGPTKILMGPLNLYDYYLAVDRMRKLAGFEALFRKKAVKRAAQSGDLSGPGWRLFPVQGGRGEIQLYDIFVDGSWRGSRRTIKQCYEVLIALI
ncbi:hypothetical protein [Bradyrhizobium sp. HKCCYLS20291]|uniref:hypothetical protein n=1 Tax=Bradyrhizobium sp. HKCCYLS20291 TaxID=3420766 RepID=UPI003EBEDEA4